MIRYVKLKNYKSLVDLDVDLMKTKTKIKPMVLVYGENGIGKSNFANCFHTLHETMNTMSAVDSWNKILSESKDKEDKAEFIDFIKNIKIGFKDTKMIIDDCKTIDSVNNMILEFGFKTKGYNGVYKIELSDKEIVAEKLEYVLNKNQTTYFDLSLNEQIINESIFIDKEYYKEFKILIDKYWGKHSFLSILSHEGIDKKAGYVEKRIFKGLSNVFNYFVSLSTKVIGGNKMEFGVSTSKHTFFRNLEKGIILLKEEEELNKIEKLVNIFFTNLYSDIKNVYYKKEYTEKEIKYKLFVQKLIHNKIIDIDFSLESTGTQNLLEILPFLISACEGDTVIIDEFDKGVHDLLVSNILNNLSNYLNGQIIITTHNTMLLETDIPKDLVYIFQSDYKGNKELIALTDFDERIHPNLNVRKRFLNGMYGGVPFPKDVDFNELIFTLK